MEEPTVYVAWDKDNKKFKITGVHDVSVGDDVIVTIKGKVSGVAERESGGSVDIKMYSVRVRNENENKEFNDMTKKGGDNEELNDMMKGK